MQPSPLKPRFEPGPGISKVAQAINEKYTPLGGESGFLQKPVTGLYPCPDGDGFFVHYQGGSVLQSLDEVPRRTSDPARVRVAPRRKSLRGHLDTTRRNARGAALGCYGSGVSS
jgi:hypothetical protein